jgi:hypothetical protein
MFGIGVNKKRQSKQELSEQSSIIKGLRDKFRGVHLLIIDEISMVDVQLLEIVDQRLRQALSNDDPFGGISILAMGDFMQLPPVGSTPLYLAMQQPQCLLRPELLQWTRIQFTVQERAREDPAHTAMLNRWRDISVTDAPVRRTDITSIKVLSREDIVADPTWWDAPIIVSHNNLREHVIKELVCNYARRHSLCILSWNCSLYLPGRSREPLGDQFASKAKDLYDHCPELTQYFVCGAPGYLCDENICPPLGIANGTSIRLVSLSFADQDLAAEVENRMSAARPGEIIQLASPPLAVNVELTGAGPAWPAEVSMVPGRRILPLHLRRESLVHNKIALANYTYFPFELAFALTYHKLQGQTVQKIILDINPHKKGIPLAALYVGFASLLTSGCSLQQRSRNFRDYKS